jgi:hypothetical protein
MLDDRPEEVKNLVRARAVIWGTHDAGWTVSPRSRRMIERSLVWTEAIGRTAVPSR